MERSSNTPSTAGRLSQPGRRGSQVPSARASVSQRTAPRQRGRRNLSDAQLAVAHSLQGRCVALWTPSPGDDQAQATGSIELEGPVDWASIAEEAIRRPKVDILFLDGTCNAMRSKELMSVATSAGRRFRSSCEAPFDIWRGDWQAVRNRLHEISVLPRSGPSSLYRDFEGLILQVICRRSKGVPRSNRELLKRFSEEMSNEPDSMAVLYPSLYSDVKKLQSRFEAFFGDEAIEFDGNWAWEDCEVGYVGIPGLAAENRRAAARMLLTSIAQHLEQQRRRSCVVFIDAFPDDVAELDIASLLQYAGDFESGLVLLPDVTAQMNVREPVRVKSMRASEEARR